MSRCDILAQARGPADDDAGVADERVERLYRRGMLEEVREIDVRLMGDLPEIVVDEIGVPSMTAGKVARQPRESGIAQAGDDDRPAAEFGAEQTLGDAHLDIAKAFA